MNKRGVQIWVALFIAVILTGGAIWPVAAREAQPEAASEPVLLRLKYATFDPLQGEPEMAPALRADAYPEAGEGAYIIQFKGPVQGAWKEQVQALGGQVMDYLPDYAFLVWMDGAVQQRVAALDTVRWVGLYQPAYKLSPNLDRTKPVYRVVLFDGADLEAVAARLPSLNTPTTEVAGEQFTLFLPEGGVEEVAAWPEVLWIENRPLYRVSNNVATGIMGANTAWSNGYTGDGQMVTVADTGIDSGVDTATAGDIHADFDNRVAYISSWPVDDGCGGCCVTNLGANDGAADVHSGHGTHVLGSVLGNGARSSGTIKGTAYQATPTFQAVEQYTTFTTYCKNTYDYADGYELFGIPPDLTTLFLEAYNWGSRIHSNSWGSPANGEYTVDSQAVDRFMWDHPDMLIVFAAGNAGVDANWNGYVDPDSLDAPGTAKNALTVGASDNLRDSGGYNPGGACSTWYTCWPFDFPINPTRDDRLSDNSGEMAAFSGRGPANDGRLKPDIVAPGTNIVSTRSSVASGTGWGIYNTYYLYMGGTSMATPLTAGAVALVREYYIEALAHAPSAALLKATLINSAVDITGYGNTSQEAGLPIPNNHEGWGRVNVSAATSGGRQFEDSDSVGTGQSSTYVYEVGSSATPLKVTLAWSDYPGSPSAGGLVNDLDLVVTGPGGSPVYYGNNFDEVNGWSVTGGTADRINNVESVYIQSPAVGTWTVRVSGHNVTQPGGNPQQPFALVATGVFGPPPVPVADFLGAPLSGDAPLTVSFTDLSKGEITNWAWDFGDSGTSILRNPSHTYAAAGDYTVSLTVTGPGGTDTEIKTAYIEVTEPQPPVADFSGEPLSGKAPLLVNFTDLSAGSVTSWSWDLGDGEGSAEQHPTHLYTAAGDYTVSLTVTGPLGSDTKTVANYIHVDEPAARIYLPLVMKAYTPPVPDDPIVNGDFELGPWQGWIEYSFRNYPIVVDDNYAELVPHSGSWLAWLGGLTNETAYIEQTVTVPLGRSYLHFWQWREASTYDCGADEARLLVKGVPVRTYALCMSTNTGKWLETVVDLSAYAGQSAALQFRVETSTATASSWYIDDVSFEVSAATADADIAAVSGPVISNATKVKPAPDARQP
jgi:serine protease AprX